MPSSGCSRMISALPRERVDLREDGVRRVLEDDADLGEPRRQLLAGAQVERRARPAPVGDMRPDRHEALGAAGRVADVVEVAAVLAVGAVLPAHGVAELQRVERADHLQLLVAHRVGVELRRRLHRGQAEELHHVVLHHVAHGARLVVVGAAPGDADRLGDGDLHVLDVVRVPQRLEQRVGEADRHQVLHRLLPEVVVDPVDLVLVEVLGELRVQRPRRGEVVAERLLHHDPALRRGDARLRQPRRRWCRRAAAPPTGRRRGCAAASRRASWRACAQPPSPVASTVT